MIVIRNQQRKVAVDRERVTSTMEQILAALDYPAFDVGILFVNEATMQEYNNNYRHKNSVTDVLSFPYHPELKPGKRIKVTEPEDASLGDMILCPAYIAQDAPNFKMSYDERLTYLLVHSACHLLGYDHITDADYKKMHALEKKILKSLKA